MNAYEEIVNVFNIQKGDRIWLSSELIKLVLYFNKQRIKFNGNALIDAFQKAVGEDGTILIPVFSFEFSNNHYYDIKKTKGVTGALGNLAMNRSDFGRTSHPMHSFMVWGKEKAQLLAMKNKHSFGMDSPFGYCIRNHVKQIIIGTDYVHAMTFVHYAEAVCNVPYRFSKSFTGKYITDAGDEDIRTYDYAARKFEINPEERFNRIGSILEEKGISRQYQIFGQECYAIDLARSFPIICWDIVENKCENIYDFNISRKDVFSINHNV